MSRYKGRTTAIAIATSGALILGAGVAYAAWNTTGTGTGAAASGAVQALTLTSGTVSGNLLFPNGNGDVVIVVSNPNPFNVSVDQLTLPVTAATAVSNAPCNTGGTGVTWAYTTKSLSGVIVAKKVGATNGTLTLTLTNGAAMSNASDTSCQSTTFTMPNVSTAPGTSTATASVASISQ